MAHAIDYIKINKLNLTIFTYEHIFICKNIYMLGFYT
jgi:hypothetical protein